MQILMCKSGLDISTSVANCAEWVSVEADIIITPSESLPIDVSVLMSAFGAGFVVMLPLVLALWMIKRAKESIKIS
ncbi:MAG: hypothetical protein RPS99_01470 [Gammaproteobacteria bacterium]